jgi:RNA polymerase sigma-70 factor (ECF subfamily)
LLSSDEGTPPPKTIEHQRNPSQPVDTALSIDVTTPRWTGERRPKFWEKWNFRHVRLYKYPATWSSLRTKGPQLVEIEDRELVRRVLAGQTDDFRLLVERHQQSIFRFAAGLIGNWEEAEDVTQEAFLAAFANLSCYESSRAAFSTWLFTIARNRCINLLKRSRPIGLNEPNSIADVAPADPIVSQEFLQRLDGALAALPVEQRSAFVLAEIEELPHGEIARIERTTVGTVKSRIHRAKQRLQSLLEPELRKST